MFDNLKGLSGLADLTKPTSLDLGDFDKASKWLRDSAFAAYEMGLSSERLRDLLDSWLTFAADLDSINEHELIALTALTSVIYLNLTDQFYDFGIRSFFMGVE